MSAEKLITDHIDIWTSAVQAKSASGRGSSKKRELYGIKKLRELILELAVRGKLVPQDSSDEPASVLLERIAAETTQLVKEKKLKKPNKLPEISENDNPFELPSGWEFVRWGGMAYWAIGSGFPKTAQGESGNSILFSKVSDMNLPGNEKYIKTTVNTISEDVAVKIKAKLHPQGTVIFPKIGGAIATNKRRILTCDTAIDNNCLGLIPSAGITSDFLYLVLSKTDLVAYQAGTSVPALSQSTLELILAALPPINEQHRIVAKVDELMALCDQLELQTEASLNAHQVLVETLLATLTNSQDATELMVNWARISEHFDTLFTTEQSIDQLKQTILQLAVMGKLVPQDPNDEPAAKLLERIAEEKAQLVKEKKIKKQKVLLPIADDEKPFELPSGWEWCRLDAIIDQQAPISYGVLVPGDHVENGVPLVRVGDISIDTPPQLPEKSISPEIDSKYARTKLEGGEILLTVVGATVGKVGLVPESWQGANIARALCRIKPSSIISKDFILLLLQSELMQSTFVGDTRTLAQPTLNVGLIKNSLTPIPPRKEQTLIVDKVKELLLICDQIKGHLQDGQQTQLQLTDAIVEQAL